MRSIVGALFVLLGLGPARAVPEVALRTLPGSRIQMRVPAEFEPIVGKPGFSRSSPFAVITGVEGIFIEAKNVCAQLEEHTRSEYDVLEREELKISGHQAVLLKVQTRPPRPEQTSWMLTGCEQARFFQITGVVTGDGKDAQGKALRAMLRGACWDLATPLNISDFVRVDVSVPTGMIGIATIADGAEFASTLKPDGLRDRSAATWRVLRVTTDAKPNQLEAECRARLWKSSSTSVQESLSQSLEVNGKPAWEIEARQNGTAQHPSLLWHECVVLLEPGSVLRFEGFVPETDSKTWLPRFREAARGWKPRSATEAPRK